MFLISRKKLSLISKNPSRAITLTRKSMFILVSVIIRSSNMTNLLRCVSRAWQRKRRTIRFLLIMPEIHAMPWETICVLMRAMRLPFVRTKIILRRFLTAQTPSLNLIILVMQKKIILNILKLSRKLRKEKKLRR